MSDSSQCLTWSQSRDFIKFMSPSPGSVTRPSDWPAARMLPSDWSLPPWLSPATLSVWIRTLKTWIELLNTLLAFVSSENVVLAEPGLFYFHDPVFWKEINLDSNKTRARQQERESRLKDDSVFKMHHFYCEQLAAESRQIALNALVFTLSAVFPGALAVTGDSAH